MEFEYRRELAGGAVIQTFTHSSEVLVGNTLGDPVRRSHPVLLPAGGHEGLPLVNLLVGYTGFGHKVLSKTSMWGETLPERIACAMHEGVIPPAVVLWPSCETRLGGSQYLNSAGSGRYEDMLIDELIPAVEAEFSCGGNGRRVLAGKSSGGYGALRLAMLRPGFFACVASHCGDMGFDMSHFRGFADALTCWQRHGGPEAFLAKVPSFDKLSYADHAGIEAFAMASCYSPNAAAPLGVDMPMDPQTGEVRQEVFDKWLANDPLRMVEIESNAAALRQLSALWLDAGHTDEFALQWGLKRMAKRMSELDIPAQVEFFDGGHFDTDHRYELSLPYLLGALH